MVNAMDRQMDGRKIVAFVGNCQAAVLADLYRQRLAPLLDHDVIHLPYTVDQKAPSLPARYGCRRAEVVVDQVYNGHDRTPLEDIAEPSALHVRFPYVGGRFYWPWTGTGHVSAAKQPITLGDEPYPEELGDAFLNRMILEKVPQDEVLRRYDDMVAENSARILRLAELHFEGQRDRDRASEMAFADTIEVNYRRERLFNTQGHPGVRLSRMLASAVFSAMGLPRPLVDMATLSLIDSPFPPAELPIHPGVAATLGLEFGGSDDRYRFHQEGYFTFSEFARRYLVYAWVPDLMEGFHMVGNSRQSEGIGRLRNGLEQCEGTATAWRVLASHLIQAGDSDAATTAIERALRLDARDPEVLAALARVRLGAGDLSGGQAAAEQLISVAPAMGDGHSLLANALDRRNRRAEAVAVARMGFALAPANLEVVWTLAHCLRDQGRDAERESVLRHALALAPDHPHLQAELEATALKPAI